MAKNDWDVDDRTSDRINTFFYENKDTLPAYLETLSNSDTTEILLPAVEELTAQWLKERVASQAHDDRGLLVYNVTDNACCSWREESDIDGIFVDSGNKPINTKGYCDSPCNTSSHHTLGQALCTAGRTGGCTQNEAVLDAIYASMRIGDLSQSKYPDNFKTGLDDLPMRGILLSWAAHLSGGPGEARWFGSLRAKSYETKEVFFPGDSDSEHEGGLEHTLRNFEFGGMTVVDYVRTLVLFRQVNFVTYWDLLATFALFMAFPTSMGSTHLLFFCRMRAPYDWKMKLIGKIVQNVRAKTGTLPVLALLKKIGTGGGLKKMAYKTDDLMALYTLFFLVKLPVPDYETSFTTGTQGEMKPFYAKLLSASQQIVNKYSEGSWYEGVLGEITVVGLALTGAPILFDWQDSADATYVLKLKDVYKRMFSDGHEIRGLSSNPLNQVTYMLADGIDRAGDSSLKYMPTLHAILQDVKAHMSTNTLERAMNVDPPHLLAVLTLLASSMFSTFRKLINEKEATEIMKEVADEVVKPFDGFTLSNLEAHAGTLTFMRGSGDPPGVVNLGEKTREMQTAFGNLKGDFTEFCSIVTAAVLQLAYLNHSAKNSLSDLPATPANMASGSDTVYLIYIQVAEMLRVMSGVQGNARYNNNIQETILAYSKHFVENWTSMVLVSSVFFAGMTKEGNGVLSHLAPKYSDYMVASAMKITTQLLHVSELGNLIMGNVSASAATLSDDATETRSERGSKWGRSSLGTAPPDTKAVSSKGALEGECTELQRQGFLDPSDDCTNNPERRIREGEKNRVDAALAGPMEPRVKRMKKMNPGGQMPVGCPPFSEDPDVTPNIYFVNSIDEVTKLYTFVRMDGKYVIYKHITSGREFMARVVFARANLDAAIHELAVHSAIDTMKTINGEESVATPDVCVFVYIPTTKSVYKFYNSVVFEPFNGDKASQYGRFKVAIRDILWVNSAYVAHTAIRPEVLRMTSNARVFIDDFSHAVYLVKPLDSYQADVVGDYSDPDDYVKQNALQLPKTDYLFRLPSVTEGVDWTANGLIANDVWAMITSLLFRFGLENWVQVMRETLVWNVNTRRITGPADVFTHFEKFFDKDSLRSEQRQRLYSRGSNSALGAERIIDYINSSKAATEKAEGRKQFNIRLNERELIAEENKINRIDGDARNVIILFLSMSVLEWKYLRSMRHIISESNHLFTQLKKFVIQTSTLPVRLGGQAAPAKLKSTAADFGSKLAAKITPDFNMQGVNLS